MGIESELVRSIPMVVHPLSDADRQSPDSRARRDGKGPKEREEGQEDVRPVANSQGQITGKLVDTTA